MKASPLYYIIFDKFIDRHDYSLNHKINKNKTLNNLHNLLLNYDFSQQMITRRELNKYLNDRYSSLTSFIEKEYNGFLIKFIKEEEDKIKELENKKKEIENISVENIQSLKDFENFGNRSDDIKSINDDLHYANAHLSLYQKALGIINQNYNNIIKAKGEYVVFFNKIKSQFDNNTSSDMPSSDNTNTEI